MVNIMTKNQDFFMILMKQLPGRMDATDAIAKLNRFAEYGRILGKS